jgi:hypothetical protein
MNNTFRESEDKRFDEEFYDSNLGYVTLHDTGAETVKSFLHDSQRRLVEKLVGEVKNQMHSQKFTGMYGEFARGGYDTAINEFLILINQTLK